MVLLIQERIKPSTHFNIYIIAILANQLKYIHELTDILTNGY